MTVIFLTIVSSQLYLYSGQQGPQGLAGAPGSNGVDGPKGEGAAPQACAGEPVSFVAPA